jgi:hypothetical protein
MKSLFPAACIAAAAAALVAGTPAGRAGPQRVIAGRQRVIAIPEVPRRCPPVLRGVSMEIQPISGGVVLELTAPRPQQVAELREQIRDAAMVVEKYSKAPPQGLLVEMEPARLPPLEISVNDVGAGARVLIRAQRARDLPELLELAHSLELVWERSDCNESVAHEQIALPYLRA